MTTSHKTNPNPQEKEKKKETLPINENAEYRSKVVVNEQAFQQNRFIQHIGKHQRWTLSDIEKRPVNIRDLINYGQVSMYKPEYEGDISQLTTLAEIDSVPALIEPKRAYQLNNKDPRFFTFVIDIEKTAVEETVQHYMKYPMEYAEYSRSGGLHLFFSIPLEYVDKKHHFLRNMTVLKDEQNTVEFLCNRHFITFSKKVIPTRIPYIEKDSDDVKKIIELIEYMSEKSIEKEKIREQMRKLTVELTHKLHDEKEPHIKKCIDYLKEQDYYEDICNVNPEEYNNDLSRFEYNVMIKIGGHLWHLLENNKNPFIKNRLTKFPHEFTFDDYVQIVYHIAHEVLPYREKHDTTRNGLVWLHYQAYEGTKYIFSQNPKKRA